MPLEELKRNQPGFPFIKTLRKYSVDKLTDDFLAGFTVALLAIPQKIAYAIIAGLPPIHGIYAGGAGASFGSFFGSSRYHITAPSGTYAIVVAGVLTTVSPLGYPPVLVAVYLTFLIGIIQLLFSFLKLGNLSSFVSLAVINGFITGSAIVIIGDQTAKILNLSPVQSPYFFSRSLEYLVEFIFSPQLPLNSLLFAGGGIFSVIILRLISRRIPAIVLTALAGAAVAYFIGIPSDQLVGRLSFSLPKFPPDLAGTDLLSALIGPALALALLGSVQALSIAGSLAETSGEELDENQELLGQAMANLGSGVLRGFPVSGSFTNSYLNYNSGARTRMAGLFTGLIMLILVGLFSPVLYYIPHPLLAGLIVVIAYEIPDWGKVGRVLSTTRRDRIVFAATLLAVLFLQLDQAIYFGIIISLILHMRKANRPDMKELVVANNGAIKTIHHAAERVDQQIAFIDLTGEAFFGSARPIKSRIKQLCEEAPELKVIILRLKNAMNLDVTAAQAIVDLVRSLEKENRILMICGATPHVQKVLEESGALDKIGADRVFVAQKTLHDSTRQALEIAKQQLRKSSHEPELTFTVARQAEAAENCSEEEPIEEEKTGHHSNYDAEG